MSTITFDTQQLVQELRSAGMPQEQAELVTREHLDSRLAELKVDLIKWIVGLILGQTALLITILPKIIGH